MPVMFLLAASLCTVARANDAPAPAPAADALVASVASVVQARQFVDHANQQLRTFYIDYLAAAWLYETNITPAHEAAAAQAAERSAVGITRLTKASRQFDAISAQLDPDIRRQLLLLKLAGSPSPDDAEQATALAKVGVEMQSIYGKGRVCATAGPLAALGRPGTQQCHDLNALSKLLQTSQQPELLLAAWQGWHDEVGKAERAPFIRFVDLANAGARGVGFKDVAALWRAGYDMPEDQFEAEVDRLWGQVKPLYTQLHCYVRRGLHTAYGDSVQPRTGPITSHLTGNMWAQNWQYLYDRLQPYPDVAPIDVTPVLAQRKDPVAMVRLAESFYTSLGMPALPETFWQRSMFTKPDGKDVVCHPSAWDVDVNNDLRIKMCIQPTQEDLVTIHHELGHNYYANSMRALPMLFKGGANDGFDEAVGDAIALSVTPAYLQAKGLLKEVPQGDKATINRQMAVALDKIAFLPFGLLVDKWRWDVFSGRVQPAGYNSHWWDLKRAYQGVVPPVVRSGADLFDPGAKYHIPGNVPYMRYFLATIYQFQFHRALCAKAGFSGPLHECSIHGSTAAGQALSNMLALGASRPWQDAMQALTGQREMDASAILDYFAPLQQWLVQQNQGEHCGW